ncbi:hypothetical protein [Streptomyces sp. NPDC126514]|uniref:hypothetical protein n=1 Tax=Streptomyces sp. NPDC126514 TaxID=3155210 RepID=UPI003321DB10
MRKFARVGAALAVAAACAALPTQAQASTNPASSTAASCYGSASYFDAYPGTSGTNAYWPSRGNYTSVLGYCNDINVKLNSTRDVRVCTRNKCHAWYNAPANQWTVVFRNSVVGADYYLQFKGQSSVGFWLAD